MVLTGVSNILSALVCFFLTCSAEDRPLHGPISQTQLSLLLWPRPPRGALLRQRERETLYQRERQCLYVSIWGWWQLATPTHNQWDQLALWTFLISRCELMTSCFCYFIGQFVNRPGAWTPPDLWPLKFGFLFVAYSWCLNLKCLYWQSWWSCMLLTTNHRFWSDIKWHEQADLMSLC